MWGVRYGDDAIHVLFNLMYRSFNYTPAYSGNLPEVDHIFPRAALKKIKVINEDTGRQVMKFGRSEQDHFANCMLLTKGENGPGEKGEKTPDVWLRDKSREYLEMHAIPADPGLWSMDRFEDFIEARKALLRERFGGLIAASTND